MAGPTPLPAEGRIEAALRRVSDVFKSYERPAEVDFCTFCYDAEEIAYFRATPLDRFEERMAVRLAWESADHWESTAVYKHYLPLILRRLAPPRQDDAMYPEHLFETLNWHRFATWSPAEREAVLDYGRACRELISDEDWVLALDRFLQEHAA